MAECWRCKRTNTERLPADPALHPPGTEECANHMDCIRARHETNQAPPQDLHRGWADV